MGLTSLIFRDTFKVTADYDKVITSFKTKLDKNFYKGYINKDDTQLFYFSEALKRPLSVNLPIIQQNFENKIDEQGKTTIKFKIVNFALILFGLINGSILFFSVVDLDPFRPNNIPSEIPLVMLAFSYGFLMAMYLIELYGFKREIKQLEIE